MRRALLPVLVVLLCCGGDERPRARDSGPAAPERVAGIGERWPFRDGAPTARGGAVVASTDRMASEIGAEILRRGGNAIDAAVATALALAVVNPEAGNIGGGGFLVLRTREGEFETLDFREVAPGSATREMFVGPDGNATEASRIGHRAAGVPGTVAGLWEMHRAHGSLPWRELVEPAIALAEGIVVHERLARSLAGSEAELRRFPQTAAVFLPGGRSPRVGERFVQRDLAETLRRIAEQGRDGFYRGRTAELIVAEMQRGGGLITADDLASYEARWRPPLVFRYRDQTVVTMGPPSSGGTTLAAILGMLETRDVRSLGFHSAEHAHLFAEVCRRAFVDRNTYLGDPDFTEVPVARLIARDYLAERARGIDRRRASRSRDVRPGPREGNHTMHFSIVDAAGMAVAITSTINDLYGSRVVVTGAGFLLNDEMDDFTSVPGRPNLFGLVQGEPNTIAPRKRMLSSMTPAIVADREGRARLVLGSPGGPTIITTVAQVISNVIDFEMSPAAAVAAPRLHHQHLPDELRAETHGLRDEVIEELRRMGHSVTPEWRRDWGDTQVVAVEPDGTVAGISDPRRGGSPAALRR